MQSLEENTDNNNNNDDDDDETVIVYGDASDKNPWEFSQFSEPHSQDPTIQHQRENNRIGDDDDDDDDEKEELIFHKRQRRSLARRNLRRPRETKTTTTTSRHRSTHDRNKSQEEGVDEFASLRSMVDGLIPGRENTHLQGQQPKNGKSENYNNLMPNDSNREYGDENRKENLTESHRTNDNRSIRDENDPTNGPRNKISAPNNTNLRINESTAVQTSDGIQLCSPPDFDIWMSDNDEDYKNDYSSRKKQTNRPKQSSKRKSNSPRRHSTQSQRQSSSRPETRNRHAFSSSLNSRKENKQLQSSQSTNVETAKSIVGLRPTHWNRSATKAAPKRNASSKEKIVSQQLAKKSSLMAATRFSFHKISNRASKPSRKRCASPKEDSVDSSYAARNNKSADLSPIRTKSTTDARSQSKMSSTNEAPKSSFSFAPSFVAKKSSALSQDSIGEDSGDDCRIVPASNRQSLTPPPFKRRRRSKSNGEWVRRFLSLQNTQNNDAVRLQNRSFSKVLLDLSDPRKRAKTSMDVTILGQYIGPWINVPEDKKLTVLGYVHRHTKRKTCRAVKNRHIPGQQQQQPTQKEDEATSVSQNFFAWFTFTLSTARRIELQQGCKLRIFNPIVLPCRVPLKLEAPRKSMFATEDDEMEIHDTVCCDKTVICTQLCEKIASF